MKDEALSLAAAATDPAQRLNLLREYVQAFVLRSLHESEVFTALAFVGGTALRFLEALPRFSEDLDFSLVDEQAYRPEPWLTKARRDLELAGFSARVTWNSRKTVHTGWVRIRDVMQQLGLAARAQQQLSIKIEVDTRPPAGAELARAVVNRHLTFVVRHYTLSSLLAGKIHALVTRPYPKGRDWYDLIWYAARRPPVPPNLTLLQNALDQTHAAARFDAARWPHYLEKKLVAIDVAELARDVRNFLERPADRALLTPENLAAVLARR